MSENANFSLKQGVYLENYENLSQNYVIEGENITASISSENSEIVCESVVSKLTVPVFFFLEIPLTEEEEKSQADKEKLHYNLYYLDNCTIEVALAIIKRYAAILFNDGLIRWGFGSHENGDEIYFREYQVVSMYLPDCRLRGAAEKLLQSKGIIKQKELQSLWDFISERNPGKLISVESDGENAYDIIENLSDEGMYLHSTVDE